MADGARIGLNEVELGIAVPKFWAALMARTVSPGVAEKLCAFAQMADAQQALSIGMVDEVVPVAQVVQVCQAPTYGPACYQYGASSATNTCIAVWHPCETAVATAGCTGATEAGMSTHRARRAGRAPPAANCTSCGPEHAAVHLVSMTCRRLGKAGPTASPSGAVWAASCWSLGAHGMHLAAVDTHLSHSPAANCLWHCIAAVLRQLFFAFRDRAARCERACAICPCTHS